MAPSPPLSDAPLIQTPGLGDKPETGLRHGADPQIRQYASNFEDLMEMRAPAAVVAAYLDRHQSWFQRCAEPMRVCPLGEHGYSLTLGQFGNFGFELVPTIGLKLLPREQGIYSIVTVQEGQDGCTPQDLYDVDFSASLCLDDCSTDGCSDKDVSAEEVDRHVAHTLVRWQLDLRVWIRLPSMITMLPAGLVQSSGDLLLRQIVRQISRRLTWKVQEDFHTSHGIPCPPRRRAKF